MHVIHIAFRTVYLFMYNSLQLAGWSWIAAKLLFGALAGTNGNVALFHKVSGALPFFQHLAALEVFHAAHGLVRSSALTTALQLFSRLLTIWTLILVESTRASPGVTLLLGAWTASEIVRYSFYALNQLNATPTALTYYRYTLFVALYPIGVCGEILVLNAALAHLLPVLSVLSFDGVYILGFLRLYAHMFTARAKMLRARNGD